MYECWRGPCLACENSEAGQPRCPLWGDLAISTRFRVGLVCHIGECTAELGKGRPVAGLPKFAESWPSWPLRRPRDNGTPPDPKVWPSPHKALRESSLLRQGMSLAGFLTRAGQNPAADFYLKSFCWQRCSTRLPGETSRTFNTVRAVHEPDVRANTRRWCGYSAAVWTLEARRGRWACCFTDAWLNSKNTRRN